VETLKPILVGEANPYGADPGYALYPLPEIATGGRLARILGMNECEYLRAFERRNLCPTTWSAKASRAGVARILGKALLDGHEEAAPLILLGAKVMRAFGYEFEPFTKHRVLLRSRSAPQWRVCLPHPSGRNLLWNDPRSAQRARELVRGLLWEVA
jgi:hypothetical protein